MAKLTKTDYVAYIVITLIVLWILISEGREYACTDVYNVFAKCESIKGGRHNSSVPHASDSPDVLLQKMERAARSEPVSIKWRRSIILGYVASMMIVLLVIGKGKLVAWPTFATILLIISFVAYFNLNYYSAHVFHLTSKNASQAADFLRENLSLK